MLNQFVKFPLYRRETITQARNIVSCPLSVWVPQVLEFPSALSAQVSFECSSSSLSAPVP